MPSRAHLLRLQLQGQRHGRTDSPFDLQSQASTIIFYHITPTVTNKWRVLELPCQTFAVCYFWCVDCGFVGV